MAKLILKSIAYYPQALAELPMSHKDLGLIDTDKPYKKLIIPTQKQHLYRLVDMQTGQVLKAQKLIRDHNDLKVYVGDVIVVELKDFFSFQNATTVKADEEPLYMVDAGEATCISGLISPAEGINLPEMYVLWEPGMPVASCLNPNAMGLVPIAGLAGISGLTTGGAIGISSAVGASILQSNLPTSTLPVVLPKLTGAVFAGPVIGQIPVGGNIKVSGLKVQAFDVNGNSLGITDVNADGSYQLELTKPTYKGALVLKVFDPAGDSVTAKYMDEATGKEKAFTTMLATINYQGDATKPVTVNITALTNLAAIKAGATVSGDSVTVPAVKAIEDANTQVANKYLGNNSLLDSPVTATVNADGSRNLDKANTYGIALELLSQIESVSSKNTDEVAKLLSSALSSPATNQTIISYMNQASVYAIQSGVDAQKVKAVVSALGNQLATGTVSLSSNASPAINLSTIAPDENSILTAVARDFVDANNSNKADKTFSNPVTYQWQSSNNGVNWSNIGDNAKTSGFILTQAQVGQQVRVLVKSTDDSGFDEYLASAATKAVHNVNQLPAGSISISVNNSGALQQNNILGIISNSLTDTDGLGKLSYQWQSRSNGGNFIDIPSATFDTYTLTQTEVGKEVRLKVSYIDGQGTAEQAFSVQTASVANVNDPPQGNVLVNGQNMPHVAYTQGDVLTATNTLSDPDNNGAAISGLSYQWQTSSDGNYWIDIKNATADTYTLTQADVKKYVRVLAKYTDATNVNESKASESSSQIGDVNDAPTGTITVSGTPTEKQTLTANALLSDADNNGADISGMTYQWEQADTAAGPWQAIASATDTTFTLGNAQVNKLLRVTVSYIDAGGYNNSQSSTATVAIVNVNDRHTGTVNVSDNNNNAADYTQKAVLKATNDLNDADGMSRVSYQWQNSANGTDWIDINSATTDSYTLTQSDVGKYVHVRASYIDLHGTTETEDSSTAARVANVNDTPTGSVTITGHLKQGTVLQAANTLDDLDGMGVVSYQWQVSSDNSDWKDMVGATSSSFTLTQAQTGKYVRVKASYTDGFGQAETVYNDISSNTTVLDVMEAPVLRVTPANQLFTEATGLNQQADAKGGFFSNAQLSDAENNNITSMQFSVSGLKDGTDEKLFINDTAVTLTASQSGAELVSGVGLSVVMSGLDNSIATVTLSNTNGWTLADAQSLIASVAYQNTNKDKPTPGDRSIALLQLVDNGVKANPDDSNTANFLAANNTALIAKVTVQAVNDAPVVNGQPQATPVFNENGSAVTVNTAISISDVDTALMKSAIVKINSGYVSGDSLSVNLLGLDIGDISASAFDTGTHTLTLTSTSGATQAQWQNAMRAVQFVSTSHNPGTTRSIDIVVNDGTDNSLVLTTTVSVTPVNDAPVLTLTANAKTFSEGAGLNVAGTAVNNIFTVATFTDAESNNIASITLTVSNVLDGSNEVLLIDGKTIALGSAVTTTALGSTNGLSYTQTWDSGNKLATIVLSKAGGVSLDIAKNIVESIGYQNTNVDNPSQGVRTISVTQITDVGSNTSPDINNSSYTNFKANITVQATNDAPVLSGSSSPAYTENASAVTVNPAISISEVDTALMKSAIVKINSGYASGDSLSVNLLGLDTGDISVIPFNAVTQQLVLNSANGASLSQWQNALRAVKFISISDNPGTTRSIDFVVNDGTDNSLALTTTVTVTPVNDAPVLTLTANAKTFSEGAGLNVVGTAVNNIFTVATFTDAESNNIASITLTVSNVLDGSNEVLLIDGKTIALGSAVATTALGSTNGLSYTQTWDSGNKLATIVLTKAGGVSLDIAKNIVESIGYQNTNVDNPSQGVRTISVTQITDIGSNTSPDINNSSYTNFKANITVQATNDAPVNTAPVGTVSVGYNSSTYITGLGVSDADAGAATTFSVKLSVTQGTLSLSSLSGVDITGNSTNSVTLTGMVADIHTLLRTANAVQYTAPAGTGGSFTLTMTSNDAGNSGSGAGTDVVSTVSITVNQLPVLSTPASAIATATEDTEIEITADMLKTKTSATDAEDSTVNAFVVKTIASGTTVRIGTSSASATDWNANTNAVLDGTRKLYWKAAQNANGTGLSAFTVAAKDSVGAESLNVVPIALDVTAVNDAPKFTNSPAAEPDSTPMNTNYVLPTGYSVDDVDAGSSAMLKLSFTLKEGENARGSLAYALGSSGVNWVGTTGNVYTFQGTLSQLNAWMDTANFLTYTPTTGFMGAATIAMAIDDQGNSGGSAITTNAANALTINVKDVIAPLLQSVSTSSDGSKIILTYNEALSATTADKTKFNYSLNGTGSYTPDSVTVNGSTLELNLIANKPASGDAIRVNYTAPTPDTSSTNLAVQDTSGNDAVAITNNNSLTSTNSVTNIAPTLSTTPVTNLIPNNAFTVNGSTSNVSAVNVNGRTVELTLAAGVPINAPITLAYNNSNTSKAIQDTTGNDAAGIATALTIPVAGYTAPSDTLVPTLISATLNATRDKVLLTYSESLYTTTAPDRAKFTVTAGADANVFTTQNINTAAINATNPNTVELTLSAAIAGTLPFVTVSYTNTTDNSLTNTTSVQDPTGNDAASFSRLLVPTTNIDSVLPVLRTVAVSSSGGVNKLVMTYSEALNNLSNFTEGINSLQGAPVPVFSSATVNAGAGETNQKITGLSFTVSGLKDSSDEKITVDGSTFSLTNGITGITSNISPYNAMSYTVTVSGSTATVSLTKGAGITAAQAQSLLTGITYQNTNIDNPTPGLRVFDIASITDSSGAANATSTFAAGINSSTVLVTALNDAPTFTSSTVAPVSVPTSNSQAASKAFNIPMNGFVIQDKDGGNTIESLAFTMTDIASPPSGTPAFAPLNLNFPVGPTSLYATKVSDNSYYVYGTVADLNYWLQQTNAISYNPRVSFIGTAKLSTLRIKDTFGAFADSGISTATTNIPVAADTQAPTLRSAVLSSEANNKIILNFDEPLNASVDMTALKNSFTIAGNSISTASISGSSVILTTSSAVSSAVAVTYTDNAGAAAIQDAAGVHATTQTMPADSDASAPALTGSMVYYNGSGSALNKFVLNFSEDMSSVCAAPSQFSVYISDPVYPDRTGTASVISSTVLSGGASSYGNNTVTFGITPGFLSPNASVSVTYTDTTTGNDVSAIQDVAGNDVGNMVLGAWTNDILSASQSAFTAGKTVLVVGGQGNDTMTGGSANDTFTWFAGDAGATGAVDVVKSFVPVVSGVGDKLDISKLLTGYAGGTNLSQWVTSVTTAQTSPAGVTGSTKIVIDVDGQPASGAAAGAAGTGTVTQTIWLEGVNLTLSGDTLEAQLAALKTSGVLIA